jgi:outer membrane protein assembly factor BamA
MAGRRKKCIGSLLFVFLTVAWATRALPSDRRTLQERIRDVPPGTIERIDVFGTDGMRAKAIRGFTMKTFGGAFKPGRLRDVVRFLSKTKCFTEVNISHYHSLSGGVVLVVRVCERPFVHHVSFLGHRSFAEEELRKQAAIKVGDLLDPYEVACGRDRLLAYYRDKGLKNVSITIAEGKSPADRGVTYSIAE